MARRYGQRPSSLLPEPFDNGYDALAFDYNVMLMGLHAEQRAREEAERQYNPQTGFTSTRREAFSLARRARAAAEALELEMKAERENLQ